MFPCWEHHAREAGIGQLIVQRSADFCKYRSAKRCCLDKHTMREKPAWVKRQPRKRALADKMARRSGARRGCRSTRPATVATTATAATDVSCRPNHSCSGPCQGESNTRWPWWRRCHNAGEGPRCGCMYSRCMIVRVHLACMWINTDPGLDFVDNTGFRIFKN